MRTGVPPGRPSGFIEPCLPTTTAKPPAGPGWLHEIKYDGYRLMALRDGSGVRLLTRNRADWTARFPLVTAAIVALKAKSCLIDGEIVKCDENGVPVFNLLRHGPQRKTDVLLYAFDLLRLDGEDLRHEPIEERRAALATLLRKARPSLQFVEHIQADGDTVFEHACKIGAEGIVSKRMGSHYDSGRSVAWRKTKNPDAPAAHRQSDQN
jgi:bifunctional non-homologous end joining protein LigD